jgi:hypothetical protein
MYFAAIGYTYANSMLRELLYRLCFNFHHMHIQVLNSGLERVSEY